MQSGVNAADLRQRGGGKDEKVLNRVDTGSLCLAAGTVMKATVLLGKGRMAAGRLAGLQADKADKQKMEFMQGLMQEHWRRSFMQQLECGFGGGAKKKAIGIDGF